MQSAREKAFLAAFEELSDALFRHAFFRISDRERAFDLVQDTFLRAWDHLAADGEIRHHKSFLYRILNNLIIDDYRRAKSRSLDELLEDETRAPAIEAAMADGSLAEEEEALDDKAAVEGIKARLPELPAPYRDVLTMRFIDDLSVGEIAEMLSVTQNVVSVRIHRALAKLRELCQN
jgi:RNA polymerase sigma-70 factor (ECF subfamily)